MRSRGNRYSVGAGARKSLVLFWTALFVCSLLLQYAVIASPALAVHDEGLFELDGNAVSSDAQPGDDWDKVYNGTSSAEVREFIVDKVNDQGDDTFTGGSSKDDQPISAWRWKVAKASQAKNDITHAFAAAYTNADNHTIAYFGLNKWDADGDNFVGFWFFKNLVDRTGSGAAPGSPFTGSHAVGDVLVLADYTNGGGLATFNIYQWVGSGGNANAAGTLQVVASGVPCTGGGASDIACGASNTSTETAPWSFQGRDGAPGQFPPGTFFEGGIDLTALGLDTGCFASFQAETRASQSVDATLSDFAGGAFSFCVKPNINTQVKQNGATATVINVGESVYDHASLNGNKGTVEGTVKFYVCRDANAAPDCSTGGTQVGGAKTLSNGEADSDLYTPSQTGYYCFRAEYTPAEGAKYLAGSHTNRTSECFQVIPAGIDLVKTADAASVSAGSPIGFILSITSTGPGTAFGVKVSDTLPTNAGLNWSLDAAGTTGSWSLSNGVLSFGGASGVTMAAGAEFHVHVTSPTTAATCGTVNNTGNATTTNDGTDSASASVNVLCPDIKVTKTPDGGVVNAGDTATFSIKVENIGQGTATGVVVSDNLPAGQHWTESEADCSISGPDGSQVLTCNVGTLAPGASRTYTVSAVTDATDCGAINNTASASATNEPSNVLGNNSDSGSITVQCAQIDITKTADAATVNAGDQIGFVITVTNNGGGTAYNVSASDTLNPAFTWSLAAPSAGWTLNGNILSYSAASLASGASSSVHVVATSAAANCGVVNNTASVTTSNDGSDEASASVTIQCPDIRVAKTAVPAGPVSAGDQIGFDVTISNSGPGTAYGAQASDTLPGTGWSISGAANGWTLNGSTLSFGPATLAAGASATVRVVRATTSVDCGVVPNTVTGFATNEPASSQPNTASASVVVQCPDVTVVKTAAITPVSAGDPIAFDITVSNSAAAGTGTAYNVTLTDQLPDGITWSESSDACSITGTGDNQVLNCAWASLAPGASVSVRVFGTTAAANCGQVPNTATVAAANEPAANTGNNADDATVVVNCPDLHVSKTANNSPINAGEVASYTITVRNDGLGKAYNVTLNDTLPAGIAWTENSTSCSIANGVLSCNFGTLDPGASASVTVSGETDAADCGVIPNTATVAASNESAADAQDNSSSASITVNCPLIVITKTADDPEVNATDQIGFVITVTNTGPGSAFGVTVSDTLPANGGLGWSIDTANSDPGWSISNGVLSYGPATLASQASASVHIVSPTTPATCGTVDNTASVTYQGGNGSDTSSVVVQCPDVRVTKSADNSPILAGQTASYTITVWNSAEPGTGTAYGVTLSDPLPAGIAWQDNSEACSIANGVLSCNFGELAPGQQVSVTVSGPTTAEDCGTLPNTATVAARNEPASATENNQASASIVVQCAAIDLVKTAGTAADGAEFVTEPGDVTFTYLVTNTGTAALENIALVDDNATPDTSDDVTVICPATTLAAGDSMTCTAELPVDFGLRTNVAEVTANPVLEVEGQVSATDDAVVRVPKLTITKDITAGAPGGAPIVEGDKVTYTLAYDLTDGPVSNGIITDVLPEGLTYLAGTATSNDEFTFVGYDDATRTLTWTAPDVTEDGSLSYQVEAAAGSADLEQPLVNTATIDSDQTQPDSDTAQVLVGKVEELTPPPTSTLDPDAPATSGGNGLLLLLVAIAGFTLVAGVLAPTPARARRRNRRG